MDNRLYVGNLDDNTSADSLRACFGKHGSVSDVRIVAERRVGQWDRHAFVTMQTSAEARNAITRLDGTMLNGHRLRVTVAEALRAPVPAREESGTRSSRRAATQEASPARITQQFRERHNITYELDCSGTPLVIRIFPLGNDPTVEWRVEARTSRAPDAPVASATAPQRREALERVARSSAEDADLRVLSSLDWPAVAQALAAVRAI
jgi:RNA recognition motif-containing protein